MLLLALILVQAPDPDRLTQQEERELKTMLEAALKAKPNTIPLKLSDPEQKRSFDLASRVAQLGLLKINRGIAEKKYEFDTDFVGFYVSRYSKMFDETKLRSWVIAYANTNKKEKDFFSKMLRDTGLKDVKRETVLYSFYTLLFPAERLYYIELVSIVYQNNTADFSKLSKREKDWIAMHNDLFP
jgi:hypothetical protein